MNAESGGGKPPPVSRGLAGTAALVSRMFALSIVAVTLAFVFNDYLIFWRQWPGAWLLLEHLGGSGLSADGGQSGPGAPALAWIQFASYLAPVGAVLVYVLLTPRQPLRTDAARLSALAAYVVRASFWTVVLVGVADMLISFLRVEDLLPSVVGEDLTRELGRSVYRGTYVHLPLMGFAFLIALRMRSLGFIWLAFLVVLAEFQIVISRFVFSYEQAFMGDLVRLSGMPRSFSSAAPTRWPKKVMCGLTCSTRVSLARTQACPTSSVRLYSAYPCAGRSWPPGCGGRAAASTARCSPSRFPRAASGCT